MNLLTQNAILYTINHLFKVAGIDLADENLIDISPNYLSAKVKFGKKKIVFNISSLEIVQQLLAGTLQMNEVLTADNAHSIPVMLRQGLNFAEVVDEVLHINADIISLSFIMLSRYEETIVKERDKFGRFEFKNSIAAKYNFIDFPIVDEYAMLLRKWLLKFIPTIKIQKRKGRVIPTHDIDQIRRFGNLLQNVKTILGGDIITRKNFHLAFNSLKQCLATIKNAKKDPLILAIERLIDCSQKAGLCSEFYFMGLRNGQYDSRYDIFIPEVKYCLHLIKEAGMIVGVHGGFDSYDNEKIYKQEKANIESVYGSEVNIGRQHYLRYDVHKTLQVWQDCQLNKDSTLGYAEREGFRCGTCHEYLLFDLQNDSIGTVKERPLIVMDATLFDYRRQDIEAANTTINKLYQRCKKAEGDFVILWHNYSLFRDYEDRYNEVYCTFLTSLI